MNTNRTATALTNLDILDAATQGMDRAQSRDFNNFLIGFLSGDIDGARWVQAIESAKRLAKITEAPKTCMRCGDRVDGLAFPHNCRGC
jgi:hypothetical protein